MARKQRQQSNNLSTTNKIRNNYQQFFFHSKLISPPAKSAIARARARSHRDGGMFGTLWWPELQTPNHRSDYNFNLLFRCYQKSLHSGNFRPNNQSKSAIKFEILNEPVERKDVKFIDFLGVEQ